MGTSYSVGANSPRCAAKARQQRTKPLIAELRSIAIGRKNWLFAGSKIGGERAAAIYTVIETCKMNHVEPQAYIPETQAA